GLAARRGPLREQPRRYVVSKVLTGGCPPDSRTKARRLLRSDAEGAFVSTRVCPAAVSADELCAEVTTAVTQYALGRAPTCAGVWCRAVRNHRPGRTNPAMPGGGSLGSGFPECLACLCKRAGPGWCFRPEVWASPVMWRDWKHAVRVSVQCRDRSHTRVQLCAGRPHHDHTTSHKVLRGQRLPA